MDQPIQTTNYTAQHPDYVSYSRKWVLISDVIKGELAIKDKGTTYLPLRNTESSEEEYVARYNEYLEKAKFYNATARTLSGFVGQVFNKQATEEFPESVKYLQSDPSGTGITLEQLAKSTLADILAYGRCGLLVDFPNTGGSYTVAEAKAKAIRPTITRYAPLDIINWRTKRIGAETKLSLLVLREKVLVGGDDEFTAKYDWRYRVLRLNADGNCTVQVYTPWDNAEVLPKVEVPLDNKGKPFNTIPFVFAGIQTNDYLLDEPPLYDLASINIAHYRNSADYEEACFMVGQPTLWYAGLDQAWVRDILKGTVRIGSRGGLPLPPGGAAGLLQAQANTMCKEAMDQKEAQMIALGARIVRQPTVTKTATEVNGDKVSEVSILASGARNTAEALRRSFAFAQQFSGTTETIKFDLSTDFDMTRMTSQDLLALVTAWQNSLLVTEDFHNIMTRAGYTTLSLEKAKTQGLAEHPPEPQSVATGGSQGLKPDNNSTPKSEDSV